MSNPYPTLKFSTFLTRWRKAILYEDYVSLEGSDFVGVSDEIGQAYFDEIHYVFRYRQTDWQFLIAAVMALFVTLLGWAVSAIGEPVAELIGYGLMMISGLWILFCLFRVAFVRRLTVKVVSPRGTIEFRTDKRSSNPLKDGEKFFKTLLSRIEVVAGVQPASPAAPAVPRAIPRPPPAPVVPPPAPSASPAISPPSPPPTAPPPVPPPPA
jgi:hypothetical protein